MTNVVVNARGVSKGGGTPPFGQHGLSSDRPSAGRQAGHPQSSTQNEASVKSTPVQPEGTTTNEVEDQVRGGDRRIARRKSRESRVTVRLSEGEHVQLTRVKNRYGLSESGVIRAAIAYLDGAPEPKVVNRDLLRLTAEVNAVGVNVNQITRQGWAGIEPDVDDLHRATDELLAIAKGAAGVAPDSDDLRRATKTFLAIVNGMIGVAPGFKDLECVIEMLLALAKKMIGTADAPQIKNLERAAKTLLATAKDMTDDEPDVDDFSCAAKTFLAIAKEMSA